MYVSINSMIDYLVYLWVYDTKSTFIFKKIGTYNKLLLLLL